MSSIKVTFVQPDGVEKTVADAKVGQSLMEVGRANSVAGILADCGGGCSCGTCHVYIDAEWKERVGTPDDIETGVLDMVSIAKPSSRLSCQIKLRSELDGLRVTVAPDITI